MRLIRFTLLFPSAPFLQLRRSPPLCPAIRDALLDYRRIIPILFAFPNLFRRLRQLSLSGSIFVPISYRLLSQLLYLVHVWTTRL